MSLFPSMRHSAIRHTGTNGTAGTINLTVFWYVTVLYDIGANICLKFENKFGGKHTSVKLLALPTYVVTLHNYAIYIT